MTASEDNPKACKPLKRAVEVEVKPKAVKPEKRADEDLVDDL
jgi:hypothetical protein